MDWYPTFSKLIFLEMFTVTNDPCIAVKGKDGVLYLDFQFQT